MGVRLVGDMRVRFLVAMAAVCAVVGFSFALAVPQAHAEFTTGSSVYAQDSEQKIVKCGDFELTVYYDDGVASSFWISKYTGSAVELTVPTSLTSEDGETFPPAGGELIIGNGTFENNTLLKKVAIPNGVESIANGAFKDCPNLEEAAIGDDVLYIADEAFVNCPKLKIYLIGGDNLMPNLDNSGIGVDKDGNAYSGVTVYTKKDSPVVDYVKKVNAKGGNQIALKIVSDPYSLSSVKTPAPVPAPAPAPVTPVSPGASAAAADKELVSYSKETDPAGSVFCLLQAKVGKVTKNAVRIKWAKPKGASKFVVYGNKCGKKNKYVKLKTLGASKKTLTVKKVAGKKVKKGTYYKFIVVALDKNDNVIATSKTVHVATKGGKVGNDKKVKTAAKKNKVALKVNKKFKLRAKAVPASKRLKVKRHRKIKYESSNPAIVKVSKKGVVKGLKKGKCYVYAYAQDGVCAKVKVTVK